MSDTPTTAASFDDVLAFLRSPSSYPGAPDSVDAIETHGSVAFLAGDDVYKLKKPVDFGFLDYSTRANRKRMCELEVELNRRLAPDVYRGVIPVVARAGQLWLGGEGEVVDYLVHMRRLPAKATLLARIVDNTAAGDDIDAIARTIGAFHRNARRGASISQWGMPDAIRRNIDENFEQTETYIDQTIPDRTYAAIKDYARAFLDPHGNLFRQRVDDGLTVEGHGDIRAEHVYLLDQVTIIDCIEFSERLRCGDVAADIGFLAMDIDALNRPDLSDRLIATYEQSSGYDVAPVLDFYRCYRAYVRGKVASFRLPDGGVEATREARRYFHLARRYTTADRKPRLLIMSGLTGSGKSTLAAALAETLPAALYDSDSTRKRLAGIDVTERHEVDYETGIYSEAMTARVYEALRESAREALARGQTVVLDATYLSRADRTAARALATEYGASFTIVHCQASDELTRARLAARAGDAGRVSDGRWEIYLAQREATDRLDRGELRSAVQIDASQSIAVQVETVLAALEAANSPR